MSTFPTHAVDWKEHPLEVMAGLDRLAGTAWRRDASRWDATDALDLDRLRPDAFLPVAARILDGAGLAIVEIATDGDDVRFGVVPVARVAATLAQDPARARVMPAAAAAARPAAAAAKRVAAKVVEAQAELAAQMKRGFLRPFQVEYVLRLVLATSDRVEARRLLALEVDTAIGFLDAVEFRTHGPAVESEVLGAAMLLGRTGEYVRALAHAYSLGQRSKTALWQTVLGRDLPATWTRGATTELDVLLRAPKARLATVAQAYLARSWSTTSRGMAGSRASLLITGLLARARLTPALPDALARYVAAIPAEPEHLPRATITLAPPPKLGAAGAARDAQQPQAEYLLRARSLDVWIRESISHARREKSGMYLRALPEAAVDVATLAYAAGAPLESVRAWLAWAVDVELARCAGAFAEDTLACGPRIHLVAGAAVIVGRGPALAAAWRPRTGDAAFEALRRWLAGSPAKTRAASRSQEDPESRVRTTPLRPNVRAPHGPSPGPFDPFVTALAMRTRATAPQVMHELLGRAPPERPTFHWPAPRSKLPDLARIAETLWHQIETGGEPVALADTCLVIARCVHGLGAPMREVGAWLRRAVDFAKRGKHLHEDLVGAARLVGRAAELAKTIEPYTGPAEAAFAKVLRAYASGGPLPPVEPILRRRFFFANFAAGAIAARSGDVPALRKALARAPWSSRTEWTRTDTRKRPPYWSFFVMALAVDFGGVHALPATTMPWVDRDLVAAAIAKEL